MAKPDVSQEPDYAAAILEHFQALPYEQQVSVLDQLQEHVRAQAAEQIADLERRMAELRKVAGLPEASAPAIAGERRARGPVAPKYRSRRDPNVTSTGRGTDPKWLTEEMVELGKPKSHFLIDNPTD